jgi:hypothetical protein
VTAVVSDFEEHLGLPDADRARLVAFLGGTIGNLLPAQRAEFLTSLRSRLQPGDAFLLGTDLVKDPDVLVAAYDDAAGVTAAFNKNILSVLNAGLCQPRRPGQVDGRSRHPARLVRCHEGGDAGKTGARRPPSSPPGWCLYGVEVRGMMRKEGDPGWNWWQPT